LRKSTDFRYFDCRKGNANRLEGQALIALLARLINRETAPAISCFAPQNQQRKRKQADIEGYG
jgi:hypothetical protein